MFVSFRWEPFTDQRYTPTLPLPPVKTSALVLLEDEAVAGRHPVAPVRLAVELLEARVRAVAAQLEAELSGQAHVAAIDRLLGVELREGTLVPQRVLRLPGQAEAIAFGAGSLWVSSPAGKRGEGPDLVVHYDGRTARITDRIRVGATPIFIAFGFGKLWVSNYDGDSVSVITPGRRTARTIPLGDGPLGITSGEGAVWVVLYGERPLLRLDPLTGKVAARIPVGDGPLSVAAAEGSVWVTNREDGTVTQVDPDTNRVVRTVDVQMPPYGVAVSGGKAWVTIQAFGIPVLDRRTLFGARGGRHLAQLRELDDLPACAPAALGDLAVGHPDAGQRLLLGDPERLAHRLGRRLDELGAAPIGQRAFGRRRLDTDDRSLHGLPRGEDVLGGQLVHDRPRDGAEELGVGSALGAQQRGRELVGERLALLGRDGPGRVGDVDHRHDSEHTMMAVIVNAQTL